jgi:hypothetical protein
MEGAQEEIVAIGGKPGNTLMLIALRGWIGI